MPCVFAHIIDNCTYDNFLASIERELQFAVKFASLKLETIAENIRMLSFEPAVFVNAVIQVLHRIFW